MKATELRQKTPDELGTMLTDMNKELFNLRFQKVTSAQDVSVSRLRVLRREIARVKTVIRETELSTKD